MALSLLLWSGVTALTGMSHSVTMVLVCRGLTGITESLFVPAAVALLGNAHRPENRSRAFALYGTGQLAGIVLGGWYGGFIAQEFQWRLAFYSLGLVGILYCFPYFRFLKSFSEEARVETRKSGSVLAVAALARIPTYLVLCFVAAVFNLTLWLLYTWLPNFLYEKFSLTLAGAGYTATVYMQTATLVGTLVGGGGGRLFIPAYESLSILAGVCRSSAGRALRAFDRKQQLSIRYQAWSDCIRAEWRAGTGQSLYLGV